MRLVADIGGTNARFAVVGPRGRPEALDRVPVTRFARFEDALRWYLGRVGGSVGEVALAAAGPVIAGRVRMTNAAWEISVEAVAAVLPEARLRIVNDLEAVALLLPHLGAGDVEMIHTGAATGPQPMLALNIGTGFGAAVAVPVPRPGGTGWIALPTEAGHMTLVASDREEAQICAGAETVEAVLSGPGHARLVEGAPEDLRRRVSRLFGRIAGDLILATGTWGGVWLCGGVLARFDEVIDRAVFLDCLGARTGVAARLADVPVGRILLAEPALDALARLPIESALAGPPA